MMKNQCFFCPKLKADGQPYFYSMHRTGKIAGGIGPTGSVQYQTKYVEIPRSKFANRIHVLGMGIKFGAILLMLILSPDIFDFKNDLIYPINFGLGVLLGFILVY